MRPIDADALINEIKKETEKAIKQDDKVGSFWLGYIAGLVIKQPTIQSALDSETIIRTIETGITATNSNDAYSLGMRNGMRWCKSLIDGAEPKFEDDVMSVDDGKELPTIQPEKAQLSQEGTTSDLIRRTETVEHLRRMLESTVPNTDYDEGFIDGVEFGVSTVSTMPTIQPQSTTGQLNDGAQSTARSTDLIDRQAAIDAASSLCDDCDSDYCGSCRVNYPGEKDVIRALKDLPTAQPDENDQEFIKLTVRNSNGRPYYSIIYLEYDKNGVGHDFEGYSSYSLDVISDYLKKYFMPSAQPEQLERCPIYDGVCGYPSDQCYDCPRHHGAQPELTYEQVEEYCKKRCLHVVTDDFFESTKPQRLGHWIKHIDPFDGEQYECSECGVLWEFNDGTPKDNEAYFCPKCGTKMKGEANE